MVPLPNCSGIVGIHCATVTSNARSAGGSASNCQNATSDRPSAAAIIAHATSAGQPARERADADEAVDRGPDAGNKRNQPDIAHVCVRAVRGWADELRPHCPVICLPCHRPPYLPPATYHRIRFISSMLTVSLFR